MGKRAGETFTDEPRNPLRIIGLNIAITEGNEQKQRLSEMTPKLIELQEQESARIATEVLPEPVTCIHRGGAFLAVASSLLKQNGDLAFLNDGARCAVAMIAPKQSITLRFRQ